MSELFAYDLMCMTPVFLNLAGGVLVGALGMWVYMK